MPKEYSTPGPRAIYPDICTSRSVAACSVAAQLLFDRLIAQADDQGRIEGDAAVIKSLCVPLVAAIPATSMGRGSKKVDGIDELLAELEAEELIVRYSSGRNRLVQVLTWWRWQQGQRRAYPSRWSPPEGWTDAVYGRSSADPASYKAWIDAAERGTAPHNAAWRGDLPHNAAIRPDPAYARGYAGGAQPTADSGAEAGASTVPDARPRGGRRTGRNGIDPSQYEARTITDDDLTEDGQIPDWAQAQPKAG